MISVCLLLLWVPDSFASVSPETGSLDVSIDASANPVDAGHPFQVSAVVPVPVPMPLSCLWSDSQGQTHSGPAWTVVPSAPGTLAVTLRVQSSDGVEGVTTLSIDVVAPPTLSASFPFSQVEVGIPVPLHVDAQGGVPPLNGTWTASGGGGTGIFVWPQDGNYSELVDFDVTGLASVVLRLTDSLGVGAVAAVPPVTVVPPGSARLLPGSLVGEVGSPLAADVLLAAGTPPFLWTLSSSLPLRPGTSLSGSFPTDGLYPWNLTFLEPGSATLNLSVLDALGVPDNASAVVAVVPPLVVNLTHMSVESGAGLELRADISGGLAPYTYRLMLSDGEEANGSLSEAGAIVQVFDPPAPGMFLEHVEVTDALGVSWTVTGQVLLGPPSDPPSGVTGTAVSSGVAAVAVVFASAGLLALFRWRRRRAKTVEPPVDSSALPTIRSILEREQVIDRETLLLLGEEAGEATEAISRALQSLLRSGLVTSEAGPGSDQVLRWQGSNRSEASP